MHAIIRTLNWYVRAVRAATTYNLLSHQACAWPVLQTVYHAPVPQTVLPASKELSKTRPTYPHYARPVLRAVNNAESWASAPHAYPTIT